MLSVQTTDWMNTGASFYVLVISYIWRNLGYDVVLWMAGLSAIPAALYEAAKVDGAGEWKCFTKITLPNLLPSLFTIVVLSVLNAFKVFREAYPVSYTHLDVYKRQTQSQTKMLPVISGRICLVKTPENRSLGKIRNTGSVVFDADKKVRFGL